MKVGDLVKWAKRWEMVEESRLSKDKAYLVIKANNDGWIKLLGIQYSEHSAHRVEDFEVIRAAS